jgi:hypothetical protein
LRLIFPLEVRAQDEHFFVDALVWAPTDLDLAVVPAEREELLRAYDGARDSRAQMTSEVARIVSADIKYPQYCRF